MCRTDSLGAPASSESSDSVCATSVDTIGTPVVEVIGQLIRGVIGRLSVEPRCNWLGTLNSDRCVSIRL